MAAEQLSSVEAVDIDPDGVFKYVLIRVSTHNSKAESKDLVRGYRWAEYHADIYDQVSGQLEKRGFDCDCLGGGRISHNSQAKKINVYGYSVGFGQADHSISTVTLKKKYPDYTVTWTNDGY